MQLAKLVLARLVNAVAVLFLVALLTFALVGRAPGDYLQELAANPQVSAAALEQMRVQYGLNQPYYMKFQNWVQNLARADLGFSFVYQRPIRELLSERIWNTVLLNSAALCLAWVFGMMLGIVAAVRRGSPWDWLIGAATTLALSVPAVVFSILFLALAVEVGLPVGGMTRSGHEMLTLPGRIADVMRHLVLPAVTVALVSLPAIARHTRTSLGDALAAPYILTARSKGLSRFRILTGHALRSALDPLTALFGFSISLLLSASLLVEVVMAWPGIGQLTYDAVIRRDIFLVVDLAMLSALLLVAGNVIGDILLYLSDPRTSRP